MQPLHLGGVYLDKMSMNKLKILAGVLSFRFARKFLGSEPSIRLLDDKSKIKKGQPKLALLLGQDFSNDYEITPGNHLLVLL